MTATAPASVWLVEDNAVFRRAVALALRRCPDIGEVRDFARAEEAFAELERAPQPKVVLMDLGLPGISGLEAIETLKARAPDTAVLVLTVFEDEEKVFRAICAGASGYLLKNATLEEVIDAIRVVQAGGSPMTPRIARRVLEKFARLSPKPVEYNLSEREKETLGLLVQGLVKKEIAAALSISIHTVDMHLRRIYTKLHVNTGTAAVAKALRERLVEP